MTPAKAFSSSAITILALDWLSKTLALLLNPHGVLIHHTHPNPLVLPMILVCSLLTLHYTSSARLGVVLGVIVGASVGNLGEAVLGHGVVDWMHVPWWGGVMCFNVADVCLLASVPVLCIGVLLLSRKGQVAV